MNGTIDQVAGFFLVSRSTVERWMVARPPVISFWREGRNVMFGEDAIIDLYLKKRLNADRVPLGQARELARNEWRQFLKSPLPKEGEEVERLTALEHRLAQIERQLGIYGSEVMVTAGNGNAETSRSAEFRNNSRPAGSMPAAASFSITDGHNGGH